MDDKNTQSSKKRRKVATDKDLQQPVPDLLENNLRVLFCGINPGLTSAATKHHFARPGNRFWKALHASGLTDRLLMPTEQELLLAFGIGITNFVTRPTASAKELSASELKKGATRLKKLIAEYVPHNLAILGIDAYRKGFGVPYATIGKQPLKLGKTQVWVFPNPSGLNAHYTLQDFAALFRSLRLELE